MDTIAPVAGTGFSHRLTAYKIVGHFFGLSHLNISVTYQVENIFFKSVTFQFRARMLSSEVAKSLKSYGHFSDLVVEIALSHHHFDFLGKANTSIHGLGEDDTAMDSTQIYPPTKNGYSGAVSG